MSIRVSLIAVAVAGAALPTPHAHGSPEVTYVGETPVKAADPREDAAREMAAGHFDKALVLYQIAIERDGTDRIALRDGGRAAFALGKHALAADLLQRASEQMTKPDAELLYLLGEAQWSLGRNAEAIATHKRVLAMLGPAPAQRIEKLWVARIHARLGDRAAADAIYAQLSAADPTDAEVALARAEMHASARDWDAAERAIRGLVAHAPDNKRANEMLAWIYEARGQLADELAIRKKLAGDEAGAPDVRDYGRALERSGDWAGALHAYRRAAQLPEGEHDLELARALQRVEHRMSVELAAGAIGRSDPSATSIGGFVGAALPFGRASHLAMTVTHEYATSGARDVQSSEVRTAAVLRAAAATAILGVKAGVVDVDASDAMPVDHNLFAVAPFMAANTGPLGGHVTLAVEGEIGALWRETPRAVFEAGRSDSIAGHFYLSGLRHRVVVDSGVLARKLRLPADGVTPRATQLLAWGGADVLVWSDFARQARGEMLDDELQHPTFSADSFVLGYRHYELVGDTDEMFASRLALADRASIDEASFTLRKVLAHGTAAVEARGGFGRDWARELWMGRGALAVWISPTVGSRLSLSLELARESVHALVGERRTGWVNYHVDL